MPPKRQNIGRRSNAAKRKQKERQNETEEETAQRSERNRLHMSQSRATESSQQHKARNEASRIRIRELRQKIKRKKMAEAPEKNPSKLPICLLILGKAGVGKTTFVQKLVEILHAKSSPPYVVNLDPACYRVPYPVNIDIRSTIKYKEVMEQYKMGPNGAILTSLNFFATVFHRMMNLLSEHASDREFIIIDTPGQMEMFNWSASGSIIIKSLASVYPTISVFLMDLKQCQTPNTLLTNLLTCCSTMYLQKLPILAVMNKLDSASPDKVTEWMGDFSEFMNAILTTKGLNSTINSSLCMVLDDFYSHLDTVAVSSMTGEGMDQLFPAIYKAAAQYHSDFKPIYDKLKLRPERKKNERLESVRKACHQDIFINTKNSLLEDEEEQSSEDEDNREEQDFQDAMQS